MFTEQELEAKLPKEIEDMSLEISHLEQENLWQVRYVSADGRHGFEIEGDTRWKALNLMWASLVARGVIPVE